MLKNASYQGTYYTSCHDELETFLFQLIQNRLIAKAATSAEQTNLLYGYDGQKFIDKLRKICAGVAVTFAHSGLANIFASATKAINRWCELLPWRLGLISYFRCLQGAMAR